uniref:Uncharacterized protein n=1 Tax=Setaria italica TaxID=4555 RepID=K3ZZ13_SETIT
MTHVQLLFLRSTLGLVSRGRPTLKLVRAQALTQILTPAEDHRYSPCMFIYFL